MIPGVILVIPRVILVIPAVIVWWGGCLLLLHGINNGSVV